MTTATQTASITTVVPTAAADSSGGSGGIVSIAAGAGGGGALVIILVIIFVVRRNRRKQAAPTVVPTISVNNSPAVSDAVDPWELDPTRLRLFEVIGQGYFGIVYRGELNSVRCPFVY
jgi:hypothetical protein